MLVPSKNGIFNMDEKELFLFREINRKTLFERGRVLLLAKNRKIASCASMFGEKIKTSLIAKS